MGLRLDERSAISLSPGVLPSDLGPPLLLLLLLAVSLLPPTSWTGGRVVTCPSSLDRTRSEAAWHRVGWDGRGRRKREQKLNAIKCFMFNETFNAMLR